MKGMLRGLDAGATWALYAEDLDPIEAGQELTVTSPQPEEDNLLCSGQGCNVTFSVMALVISPEAVEMAPCDGTGFGVRYWVASLIKLAALFEKSVCTSLLYTLQWDGVQLA